MTVERRSCQDVETTGQLAGKKIWVDLDNSPHVPFFLPILEELRNRGCQILLTARDSYQVCELLNYYGLSCKVMGKHYGKNKIFKAFGTCWRAIVLAAAVRKEKPDLAVSHGSRGCTLASLLLRIPNITIFDYEFTDKVGGTKRRWFISPSVVPNDNIGLDGATILKYPGIKEDVYLSRFIPDPELRARLGVAATDLLIAVRPPATEAHYHNPESEKLLATALDEFAVIPGARILLLPRNKRQEEELRTAWSKEIAAGKILIPNQVEDGLNLIWNSDLVISGGGTMNREAAAMGVPVYSIFRGKTGAVDRYLTAQGRMVMLETVEDVRTKIKVVRRDRSQRRFDQSKSQALETIINHIVHIIQLGKVEPRGFDNP